MPTCKQPACLVAQGGPCLEGQGSKCPHLILDSPSDNSQGEGDSVIPSGAKQPPDVERLYSGEKLHIAEATRILQRGPCRVIVLAGMKDSGKTTLLARISEYFQEGPIGSYYFAGSQTLPAFGLVSWLAMVESGRTSPDTERTKKWDNDTFLHLKVRDVSLTEPSLDLLLNDISGETFPLAMASEKVCRQLVSLARADHLVMFVDSSKISDFSQRHVHSLAVRDFLKMTLQTKSVGRHTILHVIFSRWDLLERTSDPQIHLDFIASL